MMQRHQTLTALAVTALLVSVAGGPADATDFKGRTITIQVGFAPGGGYDTYARILARHLGRHIPGGPAVVVQNMPGAGSLAAANYTYNVAPKDGTALGMFSAQTALEPLFGNDRARFKTTEFGWVGNMFRDVASCAATRASGIRTLDDLVKSGKTVTFGSTGAGTTTSQHAQMLSSLAGARNVKVITGYPGIKDISLAMLKGELDASCGMVLSVSRSVFEQEFTSGDFKTFVQFGRENTSFFADATNFYSVLQSDEDRQLTDLVFRQTEISRPFTAPPGVPADGITALRAGMMAVLKDQALIADAQKAKSEIVPMTGEEVTRLFAQFYASPPALIERVKTIMGRK